MVFALQRMKRGVDLYAPESSGIVNRHHRTHACHHARQQSLDPHSITTQYRHSPTNIEDSFRRSCIVSFSRGESGLRAWSKIRNSTMVRSFSRCQALVHIRDDSPYAALVRAAHPHFKVHATLGSSVSCLTLFDCQPRSQSKSQTRTGESSYRYRDVMRCCCSDRPFQDYRMAVWKARKRRVLHSCANPIRWWMSACE